MSQRQMQLQMFLFRGVYAFAHEFDHCMVHSNRHEHCMHDLLYAVDMQNKLKNNQSYSKSRNHE